MFKRRIEWFAFSLALMLVALSFVGLTRTRAQDQSQEVAAGAPGIFRTDNLEMVARAGFGGFGVVDYEGNWVPFRIMLNNQGPAIAGRLVVRTETDGNPTPMTHEYVKEIQLPTGSQQLHEIPAYLLARHRDPVVSIVTEDGVVAEATVSVDKFFNRADQLEIAVVDTDPTALNQITSTEIIRYPNREPFTLSPIKPALPLPQNQNQSGAQPGGQPGAQAGAQPSPSASPGASPSASPGGPANRRSRRGWPGNQQNIVAHPIVIQPEELPRDFISYDPVDVVIIADAPLSQLTEDQARALKWWVASGGMLIVTGATDVSGLRSAGLDALLPVEVEGAATAQSLTELTDLYGRFESADPLLVLSARSRAGARTLLGSDARPLVAEKYYGSGIVRFVALNPKINPYRGWGGNKIFWTDLLLPAADKRPAANNNFISSGRRGSSQNRWGVQNLLFSMAEIEPPSAQYFLLFLLFYILAVGPLNYIVLRWRKKLDLAWITIPGVVILFTVISITVAQISRGGASIATDAALVEFHQREGILRTAGGLLIMPNSKETRRITFDGPGSYVNELIDNGQTSSSSAADILETFREPKQFALSVPLTTWTARLFNVRSISESGSPLVVASGAMPTSAASQQVKVANSASPLSIKNLSDLHITKAVYLSAQGVSSVFDLEPGAAAQITLAGADQTSFVTWYANQLTQGSPEHHAFADLSFALDREIGGQAAFNQGFFSNASMATALAKLERPVLIGFAEHSPINMNFGGALKRRSKALYVIHL